MYGNPITVDTILLNATIYSVDDDFSTSEAIAIDKGVIVQLGLNSEITSQFIANEVIDLNGNFVYPGLIDAHCHLLRYARQLGELDLYGSKSIEEVVKRTKEYAAVNPNLQVIIGRGWNQNLWDPSVMPDNTLLDEAFPNLPVLLTRIDLHAAVANTAALLRANIANNPAPIEGGIVVTKNGQPTGLLIDKAIQQVEEALPNISEQEYIRLLLKAQQQCFAVGLTSLGDALVLPSDWTVLKKMADNHSLKLRVYAMMLATNDTIKEYGEQGHYLHPFLTLRTFKFFSDGALGSRGAWLLEPYNDDCDNYGLQLLNEDEFVHQLEQIKEYQFQVATHAIGDAANHFVLKCYAKVLAKNNPLRWRLEHAQIMPPDDLPLLSDYNIIPSIQATHATSDMYWVKDRIGNRINYAYNFRQLLMTNGLVAAGSDFPVEHINPLLGFYAAVTMKDIHGFPPGGFKPDETLSRIEALKAMTIWAAYSQFSENQFGSLVPNKYADLCVIDTDLLTAPPEQIIAAKVLLTMVNGQIVQRTI